MSIKTFWLILIKILGIWMVLGSISVVTSFISSTVLYFSFEDIKPQGIAFIYFIVVITVCFYLSLLYLCIFKTDWVIKKLELEKGFNEEKLDFNLHRSSILKICLITIGAVIFIEAIPRLCGDVFAYFNRESTGGFFGDSPSASGIIYGLVKSFAGYFMMTGSRTIVNFIEMQRKKPE